MSNFRDDIKVNADSNYWAYKVKDAEDKRYKIKREKLHLAHDIIKLNLALKSENISNDERKNMENEIKIKSEEYSYYIRGISFWTSAIDPEKVSDIDLMERINGITKSAGQNLINFYQSYKKKIDKGYIEKFVNNAFEDLQEAYKLYCLTQGIEINPNISIEEITDIIEEINKQKAKE